MPRTPIASLNQEDLCWNKEVTYRGSMHLDENFAVAMQKLEQMEKIYESLPQIDCGSCGSPTCKCMAEDIVRGQASETDCIHKMREQFYSLTHQEK